ncbi:hypothetical protein JKP88DRAFT_289525 [Tribonema minus]|uniref:Uncharacterized protein n=1 Tax=Tribonema minus TaxID=303371 RepID=A0A835Z0K5_9STRA|nr:hypothetical protein JKP88DRAFT_289525 [Tribonema minus]
MTQTALVSVTVIARPGKTAADITQAAMMMSPHRATDPPLVDFVALGTMRGKDGSPAPSGMFKLCIELHRPVGTRTLPARITKAVNETARVYQESCAFGREDVKWPAAPVAVRSGMDGWRREKAMCEAEIACLRTERATEEELRARKRAKAETAPPRTPRELLDDGDGTMDSWSKPELIGVVNQLSNTFETRLKAGIEKHIKETEQRIKQQLDAVRDTL